MTTTRTTMMGMMMMMEAVTTRTETMGRPPGLRRLAGGVRFRILASFVILLAFALVISVLLARQALLVRLDDRVARDLAQEAREFGRLAGGTDPETGRPFGTDVQRIFTVYLGRNVPGQGEQLLAVPRQGQPRYRAAEEADVRIDDFYIDRWRRLTETEQGELQTAAGTARYTAIPLVVDGRPLGSFVVAHFTAGERDEVAETVRIVAAVSAAVLLLGSIGAFIAAGRVLSPLREFRDATRSVSGADMTRRIGVDGSDELADVGHSFNRMLDRLEFAFSSQRDFIRDISHELRTPIAVIRGHLELMAESGKSVSDGRAATLALVTRELDRMSGFVDDLLLLAKTEQPDFLHLETVPLGELCEDIVASARGLAPRDWRLASPSRRSIVADPQRLTQAVMNLVGNSVEHTAEGDMIEIGTSVSGKVASVWVRDSGPGVASGEQRRIFERFERGSASRTSYEGSGLGLAITRAIAEAHGGRVRLQSRLGEGATFFVEVPVDGPGGGEMAA
jgi:signal transduction histidine kinase